MMLLVTYVRNDSTYSFIYRYIHGIIGLSKERSYILHIIDTVNLGLSRKIHCRIF